ncbi:MAG: 3-oxoacyl-ACP synthase [Flavobacteriaceae bacterium]|nr:3-oxoacyl-ACP synthase [Flavobacteriaceae bacterium]
MTAIKKILHKACLDFVDERLKTITKVMDAHKAALISENKSSAGDKHETGRAMLQLEMEKAGQQLKSVTAMQEVLSKIIISKKSEYVGLGSVVITDKVNYYLAISAGKITVNATDFFAVSLNTPVGQELLGKKVGDKLTLNKACIIKVY